MAPYNRSNNNGNSLGLEQNLRGTGTILCLPLFHTSTQQKNPPRNCFSPGRAELVCQLEVAQQENRAMREQAGRDALFQLWRKILGKGTALNFFRAIQHKNCNQLWQHSIISEPSYFHLPCRKGERKHISGKRLIPVQRCVKKRQSVSPICQH